ncbi:guanine nucleotide binding protein, alpha subunit [Halenospora varia]|nr:guanine nucleotide binding protein, alpha subunit [Halenospora varia]
MKLRRLLQHLRPKDSRSGAEKDSKDLLVRDAINQRHEVKVLLLGDQYSGKTTFAKHMGYLYNPETRDNPKHYHGSIYYMVMAQFKELLRLVEELHGGKNPDLTAKIERFYACVNEYWKHPDGGYLPFPPEAARLIKQLLEESVVQHAFMTSDRDITVFESHSLAYFLANLDRLLVENYLPSVEDSLYVRIKTTGCTYIHHVHVNPFTYNLHDMGGGPSERKRWVDSFDNADIILFFVPLNGYDSGTLYNAEANQIAESLLLFANVAASQWFKDTTIFLLLNRVKLFREQIISGASPIKRYFPEYQGDPLDVHAAQEFFTDKFRAVFPPKMGELKVMAINAVEEKGCQECSRIISRNSIKARRGS